jgi:5-methylcytosine-specific restriction enzyme subunit McrC
MTLLRLLEHEWLSIGVGEKSLSHRQAVELERLASSLPAKTLEWRRNAVKFTQYCGVVQLGALTIEVLPKIAAHANDAQLCQNVLVRLLQISDVVDPAEVGEAGLGQQHHTLLDVFINHFRQMVQRQLQQGLIRRYVLIEDELTSVRGRIDLVQQVRRNTFTPQRLHCRFDDFDTDNPYNQVLRHVLGLLLLRTHHPAIKRGLNELLLHLAAAGNQSFTAEQVDALSFDRTNERWRLVFRRCSDFLRCLHPNVTAGGTPALALLFDMNQMFEGYVTWRMRRIFNSYRVHSQGPRRYLAFNQAGNQVFQMRPDISVMDGQQVLVIADAKWKLLSPEERKMGLSQSDLYQLISYAQRYQCQRLALVYPAFEAAKPGLREILSIQTAGTQIAVVCVDLAQVLSKEDREISTLRNWVEAPYVV